MYAIDGVSDALSLLAFLVLPLVAQDFQPFKVQWRPGSGVAADVSFLLDAPAGKDGFIRVERGHLYTAAGKRFRIWGVNLSFVAAFLERKMLLTTRPTLRASASTACASITWTGALPAASSTHVPGLPSPRSRNAGPARLLYQ